MRVAPSPMTTTRVSTIQRHAPVPGEAASGAAGLASVRTTRSVSPCRRSRWCPTCRARRGPGPWRRRSGDRRPARRAGGGWSTSRLRPVESRKSQPDRSTTMSVAPWSMRSSSSRRTAGAVARSRSSSTRTRAVSGWTSSAAAAGAGAATVVRPRAGRLPVADLAGELAEHPASVLAQVGRRDERQQVALAAEVIQLLEERAELHGGVDDVGRELELQVDRGSAGLHRLQELLGLGLGERSVPAA